MCLEIKSHALIGLYLLPSRIYGGVGLKRFQRLCCLNYLLRAKVFLLSENCYFAEQNRQSSLIVVPISVRL